MAEPVAPTAFRRQMITANMAVLTAVDAQMQELSRDVADLVLAAAGPDGMIPDDRRDQLQRDIAQRVQRLYGARATGPSALATTIVRHAAAAARAAKRLQVRRSLDRLEAADPELARLLIAMGRSSR